MLRRNLPLILLYGAAFGLLSGLLHWGRYRLLIVDGTEERYALLIAGIFICLGIWLGRKWGRPRTVIRREIEIREVPVTVFQQAETASLKAPAAGTGISAREQEVLLLLARGLSNEEIGRALFVSANTVKTHLSNLYFKLEVKRRTQAVDKARQLGLLDNQ